MRLIWQNFFYFKVLLIFFQYCQFLRTKDDVYQYKLRFPAIIDSNYPNTSNDFFKPAMFDTFIPALNTKEYCL